MDDELVEKVARAIEEAQCPNRHGPFGGFDYGHNTDFYGPEPEGGRYVIRDFRDPKSETWGKWLYQSPDRDAYEAEFERMTKAHIAQAAIAAVLEHLSAVTPEMAEAGYGQLCDVGTDTDVREVFLAMLAQVKP